MDADNRTRLPQSAGERATLTGFLEYQRETLAMKCTGLTAAQLRERAVPPSALSLLGLVRHMAEVEQSWFRLVLNGQPVPYHWPREAAGAAGAGGESAEFDVTGADPGETYSLRYVLTHMIEEYARHNGHADLLRERIDGGTGD